MSIKFNTLYSYATMFIQKTLPHVLSHALAEHASQERHVCEVSHTQASHLRRWEISIITQLQCKFTLVCLRFRQYENMKLLTFIRYSIYVSVFLEMENSSPLVRSFSQLWSLSWTRYNFFFIFVFNGFSLKTIFFCNDLLFLSSNYSSFIQFNKFRVK